ncbi:MAG TPA: hypothetical protein VGC00_06990 [Thermoanaerobaculia bacterium]|jgi:hypothetical protein
MVSIVALWMPIVVSAVFVFVVSAVMHMALKYHKADYANLPDEERQIAELRGLAPGYYVFPHCADPSQMSSPEMQAKYKRGPVGTLAVLDGPPAMPKLLGLWFVYCLLVSLFAGYLGGRTLGAGADYLAVFRVVGASSFMAYGLANLVDSIWKGMPWSNTLRATIDGLVYALVTAGAFGWLWPR